MKDKQKIIFLSLRIHDDRRNMNAFQKLYSISNDFDVTYIGKKMLDDELKQNVKESCVYDSKPRRLPFVVWAFVHGLVASYKTKSNAIITPWGSTELVLGFLIKLLSRQKWIVLFWDDPEKSLFFHYGKKWGLNYIGKACVHKFAVTVLRFSDLIISNVVDFVLIDKYCIAERKIFSTTNGIDLSLGYGDETPFSTRYFPDSEFRIFLTCPLRREKLEDFFYVLRCLRNHQANFSAEIVGFLHHSSDQIWIEKTLIDLKLEDCVSVVYGPIPHKTTIGKMAQSDVCVFPYNLAYDMDYIYPVKIFEYMASGKPMVVTRLRGVMEIVDKCDCAIIVDPENIVEDMSSALLELYNNPQVWGQMGECGRTHVLQFDWSIINSKVNERIRFELMMSKKSNSTQV